MVHVTSQRFISYIVGGSLWVVMELIEGGSLTEIIENIRNELREDQMAAICKATLEVLTDPIYVV